MKRLTTYFFFASVLFTAVTITSCSKSSSNQVPASIEDKLEGKWTIVNATGSYTMNGVNQKDTTVFTSADTFTFNGDNTLVVTEDGSTYNGKWKVMNNKLIITETNYIDYPSGFDMPILTNSELQLFYSESNSTTSLEQKLNLKR